MSRRVIKVRKIGDDEYQIHAYVNGEVVEGVDVKGRDAARRAYSVARRMRGKGNDTIRWLIRGKRR